MDAKTATSELLKALKKRDFATANELIDHHEIISGVDLEFDDTPLHEAVRANATEIIRKLIEKGVDINAGPSDTWSPLITGLLYNRKKAIGTLLELGADPNGRKRTHDGGPTTPLMDAARRQNYTILLMLLNARAQVNDRDWDWYTALDYAREAKDPKAIKILLKYSRYIKNYNMYANSALQYALEIKEWPIVSQMLEYPLSEDVLGCTLAYLFDLSYEMNTCYDRLILISIEKLGGVTPEKCPDALLAAMKGKCIPYIPALLAVGFRFDE